MMHIHSYVPTSHFTFTSGSITDLASYKLPGKPEAHRFCPGCGSNLIIRWEEKFCVNVRALDDIDVKNLDVVHIDGRSL